MNNYMPTNWTTRRNRQVSGNIVAAQSVCLILCDSMDYSTPGFSVHSLPKFAQIHVHWVSDDIQPSHPLLPPPPALNLYQHQSFPVNQLFASGGQSIGASASASILPINIQGWFPLGLTGLISLLSKGLSRGFFSITVQKHQFFGAQQPDMCTPSTLISHEIQAAHQAKPWTWAALLSLL